MEDEKMEQEDPMRFKEGRDGDHLMINFQCDICHFENCQKRQPGESAQDQLALICIRRANLDACWARERSTVESNRREGDRLDNALSTVGWSSTTLDAQGPWPVKDVVGMNTAVAMLIRSKDPGKNAKTIQFETLRKMRTYVTNLSHTCPGGRGPPLLGGDGPSTFVSFSPTNSEWFRRFMMGMHKRMGDVWIPDRPLSIYELKALFKLFEEDWRAFNGDKDGQVQVALLAVAVCGGFFGGLRGEEIVKMSLEATLQHWQEATLSPTPHIPMMLAGRFKGELTDKTFCQPLALESASGINIGLWFHRTLSLMIELKRTTGPLFRVKGSKGKGFKQATYSHLDPMLHQALERIQVKQPSLIPPEVDVKGEYSFYRSLRRGATAHATNSNVPKECIEANNRWRKKMRAKGLTPGMSMLERYSDARVSVPTLIRFSESL